MLGEDEDLLQDIAMDTEPEDGRLTSGISMTCPPLPSPSLASRTLRSSSRTSSPPPPPPLVKRRGARRMHTKCPSCGVTRNRLIAGVADQPLVVLLQLQPQALDDGGSGSGVSPRLLGVEADHVAPRPDPWPPVADHHLLDLNRRLRPRARGMISGTIGLRKDDLNPFKRTETRHFLAIFRSLLSRCAEEELGWRPPLPTGEAEMRHRLLVVCDHHLVRIHGLEHEVDVVGTVVRAMAAGATGPAARRVTMP